MKRTLLIVLSLALVALMAGCSASAGTPAQSVQRDSGEFYGTWTKSDWEAASPEEKQLAVVFLVSEAVASEGADEEVVQSIVDEAEETLTSDQYAQIEDAITAYFDKAGDKATLQDAVVDVRSAISKYVPIG